MTRPGAGSAEPSRERGLSLFSDILMHATNGQPEAVWTYRAAEPGPAAAVVGGVHGNERAGILAVERLKSRFDDGGLVPKRGSVILALGNPPAIAAGVRAEGEDLNRCFTAAVLGGAGEAYAHRRARELATAFRDVRFGIDVHGTNTPSRPFLVIQGHPRTQDGPFLERLSADLVLRDPRMVFAGEPATLDELFSRDGGLGICYETGAADDVSSVDRVTEEIVAVLETGGWLERGEARVPHPSKAEYVLAERIDLTPAGFRFAEGVGDRNFQALPEGSVLGYRGDVPVVVRTDSLLVFPKPERLREVGRPVGYLAVRA